MNNRDQFTNQIILQSVNEMQLNCLNKLNTSQDIKTIKDIISIEKEWILDDQQREQYSVLNNN